MPELWIPYGNVETLVTLQAENLGAVVEPSPEGITGDVAKLSATLRKAQQLFVSDIRPSTIEVLKEAMGAVGPAPTLKVWSPHPRMLESTVPDLKGSVSGPALVPKAEEGALAYADPLLDAGSKVFLGTPKPDPLFGVMDSKVEACLAWVGGAHAKMAAARKDFEPTPFHKTASYDEAEEIIGAVADATFVDVLPRGGRARSVLEDAPFDAVANGFFDSRPSQARALIVGMGGRGYDGTLSDALRSIWGVLAAVRRSSEILILSECSEGLGSRALEMLATGRIAAEGSRKGGRYVDGLEEVFYLNKLKSEFDVMLLSGLPELYSRSKLGLNVARGSGEALGRLLNKIGRTTKVNVVARAPECRLRSA